MRKFYLLITISIIPMAGCSGIINEATAQRQDWEFMESVGGLSVAGQDKNPNWLIIRGDVSGLKEYSTKPTLVNSGIVVKEVRKKIKKSQIQIYVITTLVSKKHSDPKIYGVSIAEAKKGKYKIQYLNPDGSTVDLQEIEILK